MTQPDKTSPTLLCVPVMAVTPEEMLREARAAAAASPDIIELRLDALKTLTPDIARGLIEQVRTTTRRPVLATCRMAAEGGGWTGPESDRAAILQAAAHAGAEYLDVEFDAWQASADLRQALAPWLRERLILSRHNFERTPPGLIETFARMRDTGCAVVKMACKAEAITDALRMLDALRASAPHRPTVALSMGEAGVITRVLARRFGAFLTFAALESGKESAPGQVSIEQMRSLYRWDTQRPETPLYGVIGCPVAHSMSPAIHNAAFAQAGFDGVYLPFRVEPGDGPLQAFLDACLARPWLRLGGCSVTIPHKETLLRWAAARGARIEPLSERIGAANTLCIDLQAASPALRVFNTDYRGALDALCAGMDLPPDQLRGMSVAVLGAGGAARAIVAGLRDCGAEVTLYNRTLDKAQALAAEFGARAGDWNDRAALRDDVVVNCTSVGMWPKVEESPLPAAALDHRPAVFETIYNPIETTLLREAAARGCRTIDGVAMFVGQAAAQFEAWTGAPAPTSLMREVVVSRLAAAQSKK